VSGAADAAGRAARFVAARGDALATARALALAREGSVADALLRLDAHASDAELCLRVCDELGSSSDGRVERVARRLGAEQATDGGFAPELSDLDLRLQRTGLLAGLLAKTAFARPELLDAAGGFLARHFAPERVQEFRWQNLAAYACFFANAPHDASDAVLQWCGRELERGFRSRAFEASQCAWLLAACDAHVLPGARVAPAELAGALLAEQSADGGFGLPVAEAAARIDATLAALVGLRHLAGHLRAVDSARDAR
jgi:hypothetical protein